MGPAVGEAGSRAGGGQVAAGSCTAVEDQMCAAAPVSGRGHAVPRAPTAGGSGGVARPGRGQRSAGRRSRGSRLRGVGLTVVPGAGGRRPAVGRELGSWTSGGAHVG